MSTPAFSDFLKELKKFSGFMIPENVRSAVNSAIKTANLPDFVVPITSSASPIVTAVTSILENKKTAKQCSPLISSLCGLLTTYVFRDDAAQPITRKLEQCLNLIDQNCCLKIIQYTTSTAEDHIFDAISMQSILSITLRLCNSQDDFVSTSAIAASEQIMRLFTRSVFTAHKELPPEKKREIDLCISLIEEISPDVKDHSEKLAYIVFRDLVRLGNNKKPLWLRVDSLKQNVSFMLLELLGETSFFGNLVVEAVNAGFAQEAPIPFFCSLFDVSLTKSPKTSLLIFNRFADNLVPKKIGFDRSLAFFRIVLNKDVSVVTQFYQSCDGDGSILSRFIGKLKSFTDAYIGSSKFLISLQPKTIEQIPDLQGITMNAPVEIACFFITSCYKSGHGTIKTLLAKTWTDLVVIFSVAIPFVDESCVYIVMQALHFLMVLATEMELDETRASVICTFCTCLASATNAVKQSAFETVTSLIEVCPNGFSSHWGKILQALQRFDWLPDSCEFSHTMNDDRIVEFLLALLSINSDAKGWSLAFIANVLMANNSRFSQLWLTVEGYILLLIDDPDSMDDALAAFLELLSEDFEPETEEQLLITFERLFAGRKNLPVERRSILLEEIKTILAQKGTIIKKGWEHLIGALSPKNFIDEVDILNLSFRCVQIICNDLLFLVDLNTKMICTKLFFEFAMQETDINVSLSAFELMWSVVSMAKTSEMWKLIFSHLVSLIADKRSDVAQTAARTFFSLIMSNFSSFPEDVITFLPSDCFMPIVSSLSVSNEDFETTQQLAFHELAHCVNSMWDKFSSVEIFPVTFVKTLIHEHEKFFFRVTKRETACAALQFYEEIMTTNQMSDDVRDYLFDSLDNVGKFSIQNYNANSSLWGSWGHLIRTAIPQQRETITAKYLERWIALTKSFFFDLDCGKYLPPTAHKTFDAYQMLFPLQPDLVIIIYKFFVQCANQLFSSSLADVSLEHLYTICENKVTQEELPTLFILSKELFHLKGARKLLLHFVEKDIEISDNMIDDVYESLNALAESDVELKEKAGRSIAKFFLRLSEEKREEFMKIYEDYYVPFLTVFEYYLDKNSSSFNEELALKYTKRICKSISRLFVSIEDEKLADLYHTLSLANTIPQAFVDNASECQCQHLIEVLPDISKTLSKTNEKVKEGLTEILMRISTRV